MCVLFHSILLNPERGSIHIALPQESMTNLKKIRENNTKTFWVPPLMAFTKDMELEHNLVGLLEDCKKYRYTVWVLLPRPLQLIPFMLGLVPQEGSKSVRQLWINGAPRWITHYTLRGIGSFRHPSSSQTALCLSSVTQGEGRKAKHRAVAWCEVYLSMYIAYISVSKPTPWAVAGPNGQLASYTF